ncbi:hypothetical protein [Spiroplasma endosymbiont of Panorpa germanica]|uniref:hypothetical protein n=1 Tax=Spiroplasma endosymbiont of Panorpa germanica TaxID=3066314 RepID=UPI0030D2F0AE
MKKNLAILSSGLLFTPSAITLAGDDYQNKISINEQLNNLEMWESVETKKLGTHEVDKISRKSVHTKQISWKNVASKAIKIKAFGNFSFDTWKNPNSKQTIFLDKQEESDSKRIVWKSDDNTYTHNAQSGWGKQKSMISITLEARLNEDEKFVDYDVELYVYAKTSGSVHSCSTSAYLRWIDFI